VYDLWKYAAPNTTTIATSTTTSVPVVIASMYMAKVDVSIVDCTDSAESDVIFVVSIGVDVADGCCEV
jgi:hypothetical protein